MSETSDQIVRAERLADQLEENGHEDVTGVDLLDALASKGYALALIPQVAAAAYHEAIRT